MALPKTGSVFLIIKIFWQFGCSKCPKAKFLGRQLEQKGYKVEYINASEHPEEAAKFMLMATPAIVIFENNKAKKTWSGVSPSLEEIEKSL
ncbi:MAG TPA: thioredoxin family protein [archaeon]|nr:thioredoxin family protein [archaeon]